MSDRYTTSDSKFSFGADSWRVLEILIGGDTGEGILIREKYVNQTFEESTWVGSDKATSSTYKAAQDCHIR